MSEPTRDEKNRAILEWLGFKQLPATSTSIPWIIWPDGHRENGLHLPDVYTFEEASALALEKMLRLGLGGLRHCKSFATDLGWFEICQYSVFLTTRDPDRKTAIAEAAYLCAMEAKK